MTLRIGSLFSGYGGLDIAACALFGATVAWHVEFDPAPSKILAHHWPDVPNYGDVTTVDWSSVEPVDIITGGSPCQDLSAAGKRAGMSEGTRSNLWVNMRHAIDQLRPSYVLWENVLGALSAPADSASDMVPDAGPLGNPGDGHLRALGRILGDLAEIGYDARWTTVRASDIGAPHHRARVFLLATPADTERGRRDYGEATHFGAPGREVDASRDDHDTVAERAGAMSAYSDGVGRRQGSQQSGSGAPEVTTTVGDLGALPRDRRADDLLVLPTPVAQHSGNTPENHLRKKPGRKAVTDLAILVENDLLATGGLLPTPPGSRGGSATETMYAFGAVLDNSNRTQGEVVLPTPRAHQRGDCPSEQERKSPDLGSVGFHFTPERWGKYAPAIHRWEQITRPAPAPTEPNSNGKPRLAAAFAEWMMGLPAGHVTDPAIGISRADQLKAIGNGVCPQQAYAAGRQLLAMEVAEGTVHTDRRWEEP